MLYQPCCRDRGKLQGHDEGPYGCPNLATPPAVTHWPLNRMAHSVVGPGCVLCSVCRGARAGLGRGAEVGATTNCDASVCLPLRVSSLFLDSHLHTARKAAVRLFITRVQWPWYVTRWACMCGHHQGRASDPPPPHLTGRGALAVLPLASTRL